MVGPVWSVPPLRGDEVRRPELAEALISAVLAADAGAVAVTTALVGAGGFAAQVSDPLAAGSVLGRMLVGRRVLLVVDDVWSTAQVEPFLIRGEDRDDDGDGGVGPDYRRDRAARVRDLPRPG